MRARTEGQVCRWISTVQQAPQPSLPLSRPTTPNPQSAQPAVSRACSAAVLPSSTCSQSESCRQRRAWRSHCASSAAATPWRRASGRTAMFETYARRGLQVGKGGGSAASGCKQERRGGRAVAAARQSGARLSSRAQPGHARAKVCAPMPSAVQHAPAPGSLPRCPAARRWLGPLPPGQQRSAAAASAPAAACGGSGAASGRALSEPQEA